MHVHVHGAGGPTRVLKISLGVTLAYIVLLVVAGIRAHSLALLSEAGHNLSDFLALAAVAGRGVFPVASGQLHQDLWIPACRGAGGAGECDVAGCGFLLYFLRGVSTPAASGACAGQRDDVGGCGGRGDERRNCAAAVSLHGGDVNIRSALLHEVGDTLSTAAVIAGGWAILVTGQLLDRFRCSRSALAR